MTGSLERDAMIDAIAAGQHGAIARAQLYEAGVSRRAIDRRVASGRLEVVYRGVYRVGPVAAVLGREMAAVLACGPDAMVSHSSASAIWGYQLSPTAADAVDITVPGAVRHRLAGIRTHRVHTLDPQHVVRFENLPITSPARTLLDIAGMVGAAELERAAPHAERLHQVTRDDMLALLRAHVRHRGTRALRQLFEGETTPSLTRSEAEARYLELTRRFGLKTPRTNVRVLGYEVDFFWPAEKLVGEVDGYEFHSSPIAFARDRRRDAALTARGYRVIRVTWHDIVNKPEATMIVLAVALARDQLS